MNAYLLLLEYIHTKNEKGKPFVLNAHTSRRMEGDLIVNIIIFLLIDIHTKKEKKKASFTERRDMQTHGNTLNGECISPFIDLHLQKNSEKGRLLY